MPSVVRRSRAITLALCAIHALGCGWELPKPRVRSDGSADVHTSDVVTDSPISTDVPFDAPTPPPPPPPPRDVPATETVVDLGTPTDTPVDVGSPDIAPPRDVVMGECTPAARRPCYTGSSVSRLRGLCRDGVNVCNAMGSWGTVCEGQVIPDCAGRTCGGDDCGGSCGSCATGTVCDDSGHCITRACGMTNFTEVCADMSRCPTNSTCMTGGLCLCNTGYIGVDCMGIACGASCAYPNWSCQPQNFCGTGEFLCGSGTRCPRHAACNAMNQCVCDTGFVAVTCSGVRCDTCPGTNYRCVPGPLP